MTNGVSIECVGVNGATLEKLGELIARRSDILWETTKDAVISTAINILVSLRSATRDAKKRRSPLKTKIREMGDLYSSFSYSERKAVLRIGDPIHGSKWSPNGAKVRWACRGTKKSMRKVFYIIPEHERDKAYYLVTTNEAAAKQYEIRRASGKVRVYGTLAKWALGIAMNKLSTKSVNDKVSSKAHTSASMFSQVWSGGDGTGLGKGTFGVQVLDTLDYAVAALKGGSSDIELAMQKAANKTAGILNHEMSRYSHYFVSKGATVIDTPFPDIRRKR